MVEFVKRKAPVYIRYTFDPVERATWVIRALDLTIQMPGILKVAEPLVVSAFRKENVRMLAELKRYVEAQSKQRDLVCPQKLHHRNDSEGAMGADPAENARSRKAATRVEPVSLTDSGSGEGQS